MLEFKLDGIRIEITVEMERHDYKDANNRGRTRFERQIKISVRFWDLHLMGNLQELSFVKSSLIYFMQGYWKRSGKEKSRIDFAKRLTKKHPNGGKHSLYFIARQKNNKNFLQVYLEKNDEIINEVYLDGQEVLMLDIAIGKAIHLLTPISG
ncbi:MAG TPA: hypothetical protein DEQ20_10480 [Desulfobulbaceae bacterium]|nr:hypothetical protein [Desulfobulbaceae bacterium]